MTIEDIHIQLDKVKWTFAKTMPNAPHSYTLRKNWESKEMFDIIVNYINNNGNREYFWGRPYIYYYYNGYKYWAMQIVKNGELEIINRAKI